MLVTGTGVAAFESVSDLLALSFSLPPFRGPADNGTRTLGDGVSAALAVSMSVRKLPGLARPEAADVRAPPAGLTGALSGASTLEVAIKPCVMHLRGQEKIEERANRGWPRKRRQMRWIARNGASIRSRSTPLPRCRNFGEYRAPDEI